MITFRSRTASSTIAAVALSLAAATSASAQIDDSELNIAFAGGNAQQYVDMLLDTAPDVNIVVLNDITTVHVPPMKLQSVPLTAAMQLLEGQHDDIVAPSIKLAVDVIRPNPVAPPVFTVKAEALTRRAGPRVEQERIRTRVMTIEDLLANGVEADDLLAAVEAALELLSKSYEPAQVRFHEATGLLIVRAYESQVSAIDDVVDQIAEGMHRRQSRQRSAQEAKITSDRIVELESISNTLESNLRGAERMAEQAMMKIDMLQRELEDRSRITQMLENEVSQLRVALREASANNKSDG